MFSIDTKELTEPDLIELEPPVLPFIVFKPVLELITTLEVLVVLVVCLTVFDWCLERLIEFLLFAPLFLILRRLRAAEAGATSVKNIKKAERKTKNCFMSRYSKL